MLALWKIRAGWHGQAPNKEERDKAIKEIGGI